MTQGGPGRHSRSRAHEKDFVMPTEAMMRGYGTLLSRILKFGTAGLVAVAACGDSTGIAGPEASAPIIQGHGPAELSEVGTDTLRTTLQIDPRYARTYYVGAGNYVTFPANS